jgi:formylglycine-generating enzyme required for sulfatase activity
MSELGDTKLSAKDEMTLVYIPAGKFTRGAGDSDKVAYDSEKPQNSIDLNAFWIDRTEITNAMYARCVNASVCRPPQSYESSISNRYYGNPQFDNYPVINITWQDAKNYCQWAGRRLPTEAEWEKAARGTDARVYPWGNEFGKGLTNFDGSGYSGPTPVGSFPKGASYYGLLDMAGNVWEWVQDWYLDSYYKESPSSNPTGPSSGHRKVVRGGGWDSKVFYLRVTYRFGWNIDFYSDKIGFRCASNP